jgi:hypothetical protein
MSAEKSGDVRRLVIGTLVGALALSTVGFVVFGLIVPEFYTTFMRAGSATNVERQPFLIWPVALAMLSYALLMTLAIGSRADALTIPTGMRTGAVVSFLLWFTADFMLYSISNVGNLAGAVTDPFLEIVPGAVAGGVIALVLRRMREPRSEQRHAA